MWGITKRPDPLIASDSIDLTIGEGHIHALLGENGAGKSTLMNVLYGMYTPDGGQILIDDEPVTFKDPDNTIAAGIGMVRQYFMLIPIFTVVGSIALGFESTGPTEIISRKCARQTVREISARFGLNLNPDALIEDLPVGTQQRTKIVKTLLRQAKILILDESIATLTPQEIDELMTVMCQLVNAGTSIAFITHRLRKVRAVADEITVIRRGRVVGHASSSGPEASLTTQMVERKVLVHVKKDPACPTGDSLAFEDVSLLGPGNAPLFDHASFDARQGEILAVVGVQGNGQTELIEVILGLRVPNSGVTRLEGADITCTRPCEPLDVGVGFTPGNRSTDDVIASFSIADNLVLDQFRSSSLLAAGPLKRGIIARNAREKEMEYDIRLTSIEDPVSSLSSGNQQKVVVAREISRDLTLLIANQPTRSIDVGSIEFVHRGIVNVQDQGCAVLLVSPELGEVISLADRIAVVYCGRIVGIAPTDTGRDVLGLMMVGAPLDEVMANSSESAQESEIPGQEEQ